RLQWLVSTKFANETFDGLITTAKPALRHQVLQIAMALRSRLRLSSIASRNGSQKLVDRARFAAFGLESLNSTPNPVVTSFSLAGFAVSAFAFPFRERFSVLVFGFGLGLTVLAGFAASD